MAGQAGLFDLQDRYAELSKSGDPLERLLSVVDFEVFRPTLDAALGRKDRSRGRCHVNLDWTYEEVEWP